jgi:hypothetical protein
VCGLRHFWLLTAVDSIIVSSVASLAEDAPTVDLNVRRIGGHKLPTQSFIDTLSRSRRGYDNLTIDEILENGTNHGECNR